MECANNSDDMLAVDQTCAISNWNCFLCLVEVPITNVISHLHLFFYYTKNQTRRHGTPPSIISYIYLISQLKCFFHRRCSSSRNCLWGMIHPSHPTKLQHKATKAHFVQYFSTRVIIAPIALIPLSPLNPPRATVILKILMDPRVR